MRSLVSRSIVGIALLAFLGAGVATAAERKQRLEASAGQTDVAGGMASRGYTPDRHLVYKTIGDVTLCLDVFDPPGRKAGEKRPGIVFFFGGGFQVGSPSQFYAQSRYLASRGMVAISAEYRIKSKHGTNPDASIRDAKSALRWTRSHAGELGIDPERIAAGGGSAGGVLAAALATLDGFNEPGEATSVSCKPDALVIFNGPMDLGPGSHGHDRVQELLGDRWRDMSPIHHIRAPFPPTLFMVGTKDKLIPVEAAKRIQREIEKVGGECELRLYEGQSHGFFNYGRGNNKYFKITLVETDRFLASLGYLKGKPTINP